MEAFALLDYRNFARFIEDSPLERGRTFSALLGLSAYSDRRQAMQVACDSRTLNTDLEIKVLTTAMAAAQQAAQHAVTAARTSYEKVTGSPFQDRSEEHTSELQSLMRISYAVFCLKQKKPQPPNTSQYN